jgi:hypothetical protein
VPRRRPTTDEKQNITKRILIHAQTRDAPCFENLISYYLFMPMIAQKRAP